LRDHIRITQWVLFDAALQRFAYYRTRTNATIAYGVFAVAVAATFALGIDPLLQSSSNTFGGTPIAMIAFLLLTLVAIFLTSRAAKSDAHLAQHYGRQVLAFDTDFGG